MPVRDGRSQRGSATKRLGGLSFAAQISRGQNAPANSATPCDSHHPVEEPLCLYCNAVHTLENCTSLRSHPYPDRIEFLKSKGLCFACLSNDHTARNYPEKKTKTTIALTTLEKKGSLAIFDLDENAFVDLQTIFTRPSIPLSCKNIPTQDDADKWLNL